jgi:hypothetical protein
MRFLYGDSAPFPLGYNFLTTLEAFMTAATRIVQLDHEVRGVLQKSEEAGQNRLRGLEALEQFHTVVMRAVADTAQKVQHSHALDYAQRVQEFASQYVEEHRKSIYAANEQETSQARGENERRRADQRTALETFLKVARLPVLSTQLTMRTVVESKDAFVKMNATFENPDGIQTAFTLNTARAQGWSSPRRVSDLVQGTELMVGVEKSWLRGTVSPKQVSIDEWFIIEFDLSEDVLNLVLRRRLTDRETLALNVRRTEGGLIGRFEGSEVGPTPLAPPDLVQMERIWLALRTVTREVVDFKEQLLSVRLDGQPVFESGQVLPFIVRLVSMFAPTVQEITKRSPNAFELSLKMETEAGRREELYLRKDQLVSQLHPLPGAGRQIFAPLGFDSWVPGTSVIPPVVAPPRSSTRPLPDS